MAKANKSRGQHKNAMTIIRDKQFKVKHNDQLSSSDLEIEDLDFIEIQDLDVSKDHESKSDEDQFEGVPNLKNR